MKLVAGIDPGATGAMAVYDADTRRLVSVLDLPFYFQTINKKKRKRLDPIALIEMFDGLVLMGVELIVVEAVSGRPRQSASAAHAFGFSCGLIYDNCLHARLYVETVPPQHWKKIMKIPGKRGKTEDKKKAAKIKDDKARAKQERVLIKGAEGDIMKRVVELFPRDQDMFRTERGAYRMDRADAALLAKFGGDVVWPTMGPVTEQSLTDLYRKADL